MKLLSLHIEHFGRLADFSYVFEDPLNTILAENGWGKSTLAVFLKVMFYGFDGEMKRNEEGNERLRYRPWGGGIYGGSVTFQKGDKAYRMLRIFGARKKEDTFHLYDEETGLPSSDFSEQIGEELFGIDRESFSRTVFWSQQDHETEATTMIQAKIGDVASEQDDLTSYDRAVRQLKKEIDRLSPDRASGQI
ncbi:MAG: ATP-binding protein, partial [Lachnospiraceae bacterium]